MLILPMPDYAHATLTRLRQAGFDAWAVGGCVRDSLRGKTPADWDFASSARPEQTRALFAPDFRVIDTGLRHGTLTVLIGDHPVEITTYRLDGNYSDGRRPDTVQFTDSLRADLSRRDFTVNAMAYRPDDGFYDPFDGRADLQAGLLRCVGEPDRRFSEDALRILRALRFASVLGFAIERETAASLCANAFLLDQIARERIFIELKKLLCGQNADAVVRQYAGVLSVALHAPVTATAAFAHLPATVEHRLAGLLEPLGTLDASETLTSLHCDNATRKKVLYLLEHAETNLNPDRTFVRRRLGRDGTQRLRMLLAFRAARGKDDAAFTSTLDAVQADGDCCTLRALQVRGSDLAARGARDGAIAQGLARLLDAVITDAVANDHNALLSYYDAQT